MRAQLDGRTAALDGGAEALGWKIGLNAPAVMELLGTNAPVIGHMTDAGRLEDGDSFAVAGTTKAGIEPEIAVHVAADLAADASLEQARAAIGALGCAIEVVDIDLPFDDLEAILASNVFHKGVLLGDPDQSRAGGDTNGIDAIVTRNGIEDGRATSIPSADDLGKTVLHVAGMLADQGELLRSGEVIICGSLTPIIGVEAGDRVEVDFGALGSLGLDVS